MRMLSCLTRLADMTSSVNSEVRYSWPNRLLGLYPEATGQSSRKSSKFLFVLAKRHAEGLGFVSVGRNSESAELHILRTGCRASGLREKPDGAQYLCPAR